MIEVAGYTVPNDPLPGVSTDYLPYTYGPYATYTYDSEGHMTSYSPSSLGNPSGLSSTFTYTLDQMGRPTTLTETGPGTIWAQNAVYGPGGEMHSMQYRTSGGSYYTESRGYNNDSQLASLQTSGTGLAGVNLTYTYPTSPANAGRIWKTNNVTSGEQIVYAYDALNRLSQASAAGWGQSFAYDGFGNLTGKTATAGSAPYMSLTVDPTTNRTTTSGFQYDANGNLTNLPNVSGALSYDIENRTGSANSRHTTWRISRWIAAASGICTV
jgi:YD repeat-containing protein